jgi:circadian clock protein KaiC
MESMPPKLSTGIAGLDDVLSGGLARGATFLLEGHPGTGKTTAALQFVRQAANAGERPLYVTLSETKQELVSTAKSHGWTLDGQLEILELQASEALLDPDQQQTLLYSSDLELDETTKQIVDAIKRANATVVVLDSLSEIRLLAQGSLRYRRQLLALKHFFANRAVTVLLLDDLTAEAGDKTAHSIVHGVFRLEERTPQYGSERRYLKIVKYRGQAYRGGYHDFTIRKGGLEVYPRLIAAEHRDDFEVIAVKSGVPGLDDQLCGGIDKGTSTLFLGPAGIGKTILGLQYVKAALQRGEKAAMFIFDADIEILMRRAKAMNLDLEGSRRAGALVLSQVDAAELSPGEFAHKVRQAVDGQDVGTVVIDSLNGYRAAMPEENSLTLHIHELLLYLNRRGTSTFLTVAQHGLVGDMKSPVDITYLADTVVLFRFFEAGGRMRRAISVVKKRTGPHQDTIRELEIAEDGITVGEPLHEFQGILRGVPTFIGMRESLPKE